MTAAAMNFLPDEIPLHYDLEGIVDRTGSKYEMFVLTGLAAAFVVFWELFVRVYIRKSRRAKDEKTAEDTMTNAKIILYAGAFQTGIQTLIQLIFVFAAFGGGAAAASPSEWIYTVLCAACGAGQIFLGNYIPKTKRGGPVGLRTTWSVKNDMIWAKSNRFAGVMMCASGVAAIAEGFVLKGIASVFAMLGALAAAAAASTVYSYILYRQDAA